MTGVKINRAHPRYEEYIQKCQDLFDSYQIIIDEELAKYPDWKGLDHPAYVKTVPLERERNKKLKELKAEYSFLFSKE